MQGEASTRPGFTDYFRVELVWAKLLGAVLLLAPVPARLKEWAYGAFASPSAQRQVLRRPAVPSPGVPSPGVWLRLAAWDS